MRYISSTSSCISNLRESLHIESKSKRYSNTPAHTASQAYAKESNCDPLYQDVCIPSPPQWIGNNYLCFRCGTTFSNSPFGYKQHEEQYITNPHDVILFDYDALMPMSKQKQTKHSPVNQPSQQLSISKDTHIDTKHIIATYELRYQKEEVIAFGIYADDIITSNKSDKYFDSLLKNIR